MTEKKKVGLWDRTKDVAATYTGTFIVVMFLNQLLFFGFCLNPICIIAAMPHVLLITVFLGSIFNRIGKWGERGLAKKTLNTVGKKLDDVGEIFSASEEILESSKKHNETLRTAQYEQSIDSLRELQDLQVKYKNKKAELARRAKDRTKDIEFKDDEGSAQESFNQANRYSKKGNEWEALANLNKNFGATPSKKIIEFLKEHKANRKRSAQEDINQANEKEVLESSDTDERSAQEDINQANEYSYSEPRKKIIEFLKEHKANRKRSAQEDINQANEYSKTHYGEKSGEIWSDQENSKLVSLWNQGKSSIEISKIHQRSSQAILRQLWELKVSETRSEVEILDRKRRGLPIGMTTKPNDPRLINLPKESLPEAWARGEKWTSTLDSELVKDWQSGMELIPILKKYGRTPIAILARLCQLGELSEEINPVELWNEMNSKDGKKESDSEPTPETDWYENGQKKSEGNCKDGKKNGLWTWWYENGNKELEKNYKDNKLDGLSG